MLTMVTALFRTKKTIEAIEINENEVLASSSKILRTQLIFFLVQL